MCGEGIRAVDGETIKGGGMDSEMTDDQAGVMVMIGATAAFLMGVLLGGLIAVLIMKHLN
jgi:hypothetical protein